MQNLSKEEIVHSALAGLARRLGPNSKLPTVRSLCTKLSVSRSTLDRVLRQLENDRIVVCRHGSGIYVSRYCNQRRIALVFGGNIHDALSHSQFWSLLHGSVLRQGEHNGDEIRTYYGCPFGYGPQGEPTAFALADDLESKSVHGVLTAGLASEEALKWLKSWNVPVVSLSSASIADVEIGIDAAANIKMAVEGLKQAGCRKIGIVWRSYLTSEALEEDATTISYRKALEEAGLPYHRELLWATGTLPGELQSQTREELGELLMKAHGGEGKDVVPDSLFFMDDTMAHGALIALLENGIKIGKDLKVAVQCNKGASLLRPFHHSIYRVEIDPDEIGSLMYGALNRLLQGTPSSVNRLMTKAVFTPPNQR